MTYTRAAALELKLRVAETLGLPTDAAALKKHLPWIGTIHCSPPDEQVLTTTRGWVPIGNLSDSDRLASYSPAQNRVVRGAWAGKSLGYPFEIASRPYDGDLLTLSTAESTTRVTPNHRVRARFSLDAQRKFVVYLMRRGNWWRIGRTKTFSIPFVTGGVPGRLATEKGDAAWVLGYYDTMNDAAYHEARIIALYGVPGLTFEITTTGRALTSKDVYRVHEEASQVVTARALHLLSDWGMSVDTPLFEPRRRGTGEPRVRYGYWFDTAASNLVPGLMELPISHEKSRVAPQWLPLAIKKEHYEGPVYSLDVSPYHYYHSGGAIVHNSLSYRLAGRPKLVDPEAAYAFLSGKPAKSTYGMNSDSPLQGWDGDLDEYALALRLASSAKHRLVHPYDALKTLPLAALAQTTPDRLFALVKKYRDWKHETGTVDYEDLLERGAQHAPPVSALFLDEAQDCSKLLWKTLDAWQQGVTLSVSVGDPWQAIHQFSGADPQGFRDRPGRWVSLGASYRLQPDAVTYAQKLLHRAGWNDPLIDSWHGEGKGEETDGGSTAYLARTHKLVGEWEKDLISRGEPFGRLGGKAPLAQASLPAWQALKRIVAGESLPAYQLEPTVSYLLKVGISAGSTEAIQYRKLLRDPQVPVSAADILAATGVPAAYLLEKIPWGSYYRRVEQRHGAAALTATPKITLGTGHSAKGLEWDHVRVLRQWGTIPSRALQEEASAKDESCVAFVMTTRHRVLLQLTDLGAFGNGGTYPF